MEYRHSSLTRLDFKARSTNHASLFFFYFPLSISVENKCPYFISHFDTDNEKRKKEKIVFHNFSLSELACEMTSGTEKCGPSVGNALKLQYCTC